MYMIIDGNLIGLWYSSTSDGYSFKLKITEHTVVLLSNYEQKHPAFYDTLMSEEKCIGKMEGNNLKFTESLTIVDYKQGKDVFTVFRKEPDGILVPINFVKRHNPVI